MNVSTKQQRIAEISKRTFDRNEPITLLHHNLDLEWLGEAYKRLKKHKAPGIDGVTVEEYGLNLEENNKLLLEEVLSGRYVAPPVRGVDIPKPGSKEMRGLGIPTVRDKVLQKAIQMLLEPIYEMEFYQLSYGFRPHRSQHDALQHLWNGITYNGVGWIIDLDIRKFFDTVDHGELREMFRDRVKDGVITKLVDKWLKAGIMKDGGITHSDEGTPQGGIISPLLSNIYLHVVMDKWFIEEIWPNLMGRSTVVRFADDVILGFEHLEDAEMVLKKLHKRFNQYGLTLHPTKTRLVNFEKPKTPPPPKGKSASGGKETPKLGKKPETFTFLGFSHYWGISQKGNWAVMRKTSRKKLTEKLKKMNEWCRINRHLLLPEQHKAMKLKLLGHYQYYGITGNAWSLGKYLYQVKRIWKKWLSRRSWGSMKMTWEQFNQLLKDKIPLPPIKIPHSVFAAKP